MPTLSDIMRPEFFEVESMAGTLHFGSLRPGPGEGTLEVVALVADWGNAVLPLREVARIQLVKSGFWDRFRGTIDAGASYTSASELLEWVKERLFLPLAEWQELLAAIDRDRPGASPELLAELAAGGKILTVLAPLAPIPPRPPRPPIAAGFGSEARILEICA